MGQYASSPGSSTCTYCYTELVASFINFLHYCSPSSRFYAAWKDNRNNAPTICVDTIPSFRSVPPPPLSPHFYAEALSAAILPSYPGLGQAPNNAGLHMISSLVKKQAKYIKQMQKTAP